MEILKKAISALLALVLVMGMLPAPAYAEEAETTEPVSITEEVVLETIPVTIPAETAPTETAPAPEPTVAEAEPKNAVIEDELPLVGVGGNPSPGTPDGEPPVLNGIALSAYSVTPGSTIEVIVDASDDVSGVEHAEVHFRCEETDKQLYCWLTSSYYDQSIHEEVKYEDGKLHGTLEIDQYVETGTFFVDTVYLRDYAENSKSYSSRANPEHEPDRVLPDAVKVLQFYVTESETPDGAAPVLNAISLSAESVTAPGTLEVIVDASDDVSGVEHAEIHFRCEETDKQLYCWLTSSYYDQSIHEEVKYEDGKLHGTLEIDQYVETGTFFVDTVYLRDYAENSKSYSSRVNPEHEPDRVLPDSVKSLSLYIFNTIPDVTTSVANPGFIDKLESAEDNAYIVADYSGDATLTEAAFNAIAGTDKTLDLASEGITWRFNGNDITEDIKPIDLKVNITPVEEEGSENGEAIADQLKDNPGVVMKFAENGTLPGKATIQVKVDYAMRKYLGSDENLCVYYYNNETGKLELIAEDLKVVNDTYVEFSITHCSYYVLAPKLPEETEEVSWSFDEATNTLHITGDGPMEDYKRKGAPWYDIRDKIFDIEIEEGITHIGAYAFYGCDHVVDITIPASVVSIGTWAFQATDLVRVIFQGSAPDGYVGGYKNCIAYHPKEDPSWTAEATDNLNFQFTWIPYEAGTTPEIVTSGTCGEDLTWSFDEASGKLTITGSGAMEEFSSGAPWGQFRNDILSIQLDDRITHISTSAFEGCSRLRTVNIPKSLQATNEYGQDGAFAFRDCVSLDCEIVIPDGVMVTAYGMFYDCTSLKDVKLPKTLKTIGGGTFLGCTSLESIQIPKAVTHLNENAFDGCTSLKTLTLPKTVEYIAGWTFNRCTSLESINIPQGVEWIGMNTFANCNSLKKIELPESVMTIAYGAFANCWDLASVKLPDKLEYIGSDAFHGCKSLTEVTIPDSISYIDQGTFYDCAALERIEIPETVTDISHFAFMNCTSLKEINLPEKLTGLSRSVLYNCQSLKALTIPASVSWIDSHALAFCEGLEEITFEGNAPTFAGGIVHPLFGEMWHNFQEVDATAYYPAGDKTWTEDVRKDYGGKIIWVPKAPQQMGDPNGDNKINAKDSTLILQYSVGVLKDSVTFDLSFADVNKDGKINAKDATLILQYSVGLRTEFPGQK